LGPHNIKRKNIAPPLGTIVTILQIRRPSSSICKEEPSDVAILLSEAPNRIVQDLEKASGLLLNYIFYLLTPVESATNSYKSVYMHNTCSFHQEVASTSGLHYDIYKNKHAFIRTNAIVDTAIQGQSGSL